MPRKLVLRNNRKTTLTGALAANATTFTNALLTNDIIQPDPFIGVWGTNELIATLDDGTNLEIIAIVMAQQNAAVWTYTIERGLEGTTPRAWAAGAKFEFRLTAGMLEKLAQISNTGWDFSFIEYAVTQEIKGGQPGRPLLWAADTDVEIDSMYFIKSGADFQWALFALVDGITGSTVPNPTATLFDESGIIVDGTMVWWFVKLTTAGDIDVNRGQNLANRSGTGTAFGGAAVTIGGAKNTGNGAFVISGTNTENYGYEKSTILGGDSILNFASRAAILAPEAISTEGSNVPNSFLLGYVPSKPQGMSDVLLGFPNQIGVDGIIWSPIVDLAGGAAWTANTPMRQGEIRRPTTANNCQYLRIDYKHNKYYGVNPAALYTAFGLTGPTQPAWTTTFGDYIDDWDGAWICLPNTAGISAGLGTTIPFLVKEVGFLLHNYVAPTAQPFISVGDSVSSTNILANTQTTLLTAVGRAQIYTIAAPKVSTDIKFFINTLATGASARMVGQFWVRGHYVPAYR